MIPEVVHGERLTASRQNEIIRACNGLQQPSESYVNTQGGPLFPNPVPGFAAVQGRCVETVFQLKFGLKQVIKRRSQDHGGLSDEYELSDVAYGYSINLGNDIDKLRDVVGQMNPGNDDIFTIGSQASQGGCISAHLDQSDQLVAGSDKAGFFDIGAYWRSDDDGCTGIKAEKLLLSTDLPAAGFKRAFVVKGDGAPSHEAVTSYYAELSGGEWKVQDSKEVDIGYLRDQRLVQLRLAFPDDGQEGSTVDSLVPELEMSSVQSGSLSGVAYHQFFNFQVSALSDFQLSDSQYYDVVVRDRNPDHVDPGAIVNYIPLSDLLSAQGASCNVNFDASMKASIFCYDVQTGEGEHGGPALSCTRWAWRVWLGKGSSYSAGMAGGDACTVGGNPVMFDCSDDAPTRDWNGSPIWWQDSLWVGTRTVMAGGTLAAGELWLEIGGDPGRGLVVGRFSS